MMSCMNLFVVYHILFMNLIQLGDDCVALCLCAGCTEYRCSSTVVCCQVVYCICISVYVFLL